ncbi:DUF6233 domain-containing protein [Streptomyces sp. NPDC056061]|uniref:DUF6233 domain-containing protein n=1 Tax=Streptomyces sp. NPDC056061 TaxID=3345700 RepID=UPI0035D8EAE9
MAGTLHPPCGAQVGDWLISRTRWRGRGTCDQRPSGWVLQKLGGRRPGQAVVHAVDCDEAPPGAPVLSLDRALDAAERPGVRLCTWCGAAAELAPVLRGFGHED